MTLTHSDIDHSAIPGLVGVLSTTPGIDGKAVAATNLYTVPAGKIAVITGAFIRVTAVDALIVAATAGIGVAAGEADIAPAIALTGLNVAGEAFNVPLVVGVGISVAAAGVVKLGIDVGATATTLTLAVDLLGYLVDA